MIQRKSILSFLILCFYFVLFYLLFLFKAFSLTQCFFFYNLSQTYFHVLQIPRSRQILSQLTTISTSPVYICLPYFLFLSPFSLYSLSPVCLSLSPCFLLNSIFSFFFSRSFRYSSRSPNNLDLTLLSTFSFGAIVFRSFSSHFRFLHSTILQIGSLFFGLFCPSFLFRGLYVIFLFHSFFFFQAFASLPDGHFFLCEDTNSIHTVISLVTQFGGKKKCFPRCDQKTSQ